MLHLDLLRLVAICCVIFNHTGDRGYLLFADNVGTWTYFPCMLVSIICKVAVPIFFMISGALLLPKQESLKTLFSKRIFRILAVLVLISVPYFAWLHGTRKLDISSFLIHIYKASASTSLWYLYSYLALLATMPFLRSMVRSMTKQEFWYLFAGYIVMFGMVPCMEFLLWQGNVTIHESFEPVLFLTPNVFYAIAGYYLEYVADYRKNRKRILLLGVGLSGVALAITCFMTHDQLATAGKLPTEQLERFFNCFICVPAMTLYYVMKCIGENLRSKKIRKLLSVLGGTVFGIYLIEKFARALTDPIYVLIAPVVGSFAASLIWSLAALCVSFIVVVSLKHMPVIKNAVNRFI